MQKLRRAFQAEARRLLRVLLLWRRSLSARPGSRATARRAGVLLTVIGRDQAFAGKRFGAADDAAISSAMEPHRQQDQDPKHDGEPQQTPRGERYDWPSIALFLAMIAATIYALKSR